MNANAENVVFAITILCMGGVVFGMFLDWLKS